METVGKKLKGLREEKGMTLKDVARAIKVRESVLTALENEEWNKLPQRIFVKGFVRAYARAVDGDEEEILDLFEASYPVKDVPIACPAFEAQIREPFRRGKKRYGRVIVFLILIVLGVGGALFLTRAYHSTDLFTGIHTPRVETTVVKPQEKTITVTPSGIPGSSSSISSKKNKHLTSPALSESPATLTSQGVPSSKASAERGKTLPETAETGPTLKASTPAVPAIKTGPPPLPAPSAEKESPSPPSLSKDNLIITAKMKTWVGLKVGGKLRKQILLSPGKRFSTRVDQPVELLIGNAGGIEITYNGKEIKNIGKPGQVVRLKLPLQKRHSP